MTKVADSPAWVQRLGEYTERLSEPPGPIVSGALTRVIGLTLEASGCRLSLGDRCHIHDGGGRVIEAEAVGFDNERVYLMPVEEPRGLSPDARVVRAPGGAHIGVSDALRGRVINALGEPIDGGEPIKTTAQAPLFGQPLNPLKRAGVTEPLDVGVRAINALNTVGRGQRMGLFAASGVGKSVLLGMMTRYTEADIVVVGLIGERGREVGDFVRRVLGEQGLRRAVVVAAPADTPPLMRVHGALRATAIAEYFRDLGLRVLLLMDSLTRFAQAQREIALAVGEPPATKGYTPSVFAQIPRLVERAGNSDHGPGSITALYTVLTEDGDTSDPVAYAARAILDGHIVLSREIAESGRYPAINVESSVSRVMNDVIDKDHLGNARRFRRLYAHYSHNRELIRIGAYQRGSDRDVDTAIDMQPAMEDFLQQDIDEAASLDNSRRALGALFTEIDRKESQKHEAE